jgi:hypothetical protein
MNRKKHGKRKKHDFYASCTLSILQIQWVGLRGMLSFYVFFDPSLLCCLLERRKRVLWGEKVRRCLFYERQRATEGSGHYRKRNFR